MRTILFILGTRPEVIKLAPVIQRFAQAQEKYTVLICNTEQQKELSNQTLAYFDLTADFSLDCMRPNQTLAATQARILTALEDIFTHNAIDMAFVQGDTMTVLCGALAAYYHRVPIAHVEAGLRSGNLAEPFPEEAVRQMTARIAALHFAPTQAARNALLAENIPNDQIHVVGNTVIDALHSLAPAALDRARRWYADQSIGLHERTVLATIHRRENHGERLEHILSALTELAQQYTDHEFILPVHPNPNVKTRVHAALGNLPNVRLLPPLDYPCLVWLMQNAKLVLTDSGGIQEEAPTFGVPVLVLRYATERMEGVEAGAAVLVGADKTRILEESAKVLSASWVHSRLSCINPYGDGQSSSRIAAITTQWVQSHA